MSRPHTQEEMVKLFLYHLDHTAEYWAKVNIDDEVRKIIDKNYAGNETHYRTAGVVFSILSMIDGCAGDLPAFAIVPQPHPEDEQYHKDQGENYWPTAPDNIYEIAFNTDHAMHEMKWSD